MSIDGIFVKIVNMSIVAGWMILAIVLLRLLLKKAPRRIFCILWALAAVRLVCPFSFESRLSLIPSSETIPSDIEMMHRPSINSGITMINEAINPVIEQSFTPNPGDSANPLQIVIRVISVVWIAGMAAMLLYALISSLRLKKHVGAAVTVRDNILACDEVESPFILGTIKPYIYVPSSMEGDTLDYVIAHEVTHIRRGDHWWKPIGFLILSVYWFNPLCWLAYILLCRDIEMACDEKVIRDMDNDARAAYSQALLNCSFPRKRVAACPLAFGEVGVKERIRSVLDYKKPAFWVIIVAIAVCIAVVVLFMTDPFSGKNSSGEQVAGVQLLDVVSNSEDSCYRIAASTAGTDFSSIGQVLADMLAEDWARYDGMTPEQRMVSSHAPGWISLGFDNWNDCEAAIGFKVDNPLESLDWLNKTGYFGSESSYPDMPVQFIQVSARATNVDRKLQEINIDAGYNSGNAHVTLTATLFNGDGEYNHLFGYSGYAVYEKKTVLTGSGIPVLMIVTDGTNNLGYYSDVFSDVNVFWVRDNVFYNLRVFGDIKDKDEIQAVLDKIIADI